MVNQTIVNDQTAFNVLCLEINRKSPKGMARFKGNP